MELFLELSSIVDKLGRYACNVWITPQDLLFLLGKLFDLHLTNLFSTHRFYGFFGGKSSFCTPLCPQIGSACTL